MRVLGKAIVRSAQPYRVVVAGHLGFMLGVSTTREVQPAGGVTLAETDSRDMALWLAAAINHALDGEPFGQPRPDGVVASCGYFAAFDCWVLAWSRQRDGVQLARCSDQPAACSLAASLNSLIGECLDEPADSPRATQRGR